MTEINDSGFNRDRYQDERDSIAARWNFYLPGRRTDAQSVNGRIISIEAELVDNQNSQIGALLESFSPFTARGNLLSRLSPLMSKRRREAVRSTVTLTVTAGPAGATIPAGSIVSQVSGPAKFATTAQVVVAPNGSASVPARATEDGAIVAATGTLTKIDTPVSGWASVTNAADASIGRSRESDGQLRARMLATSSAPVGTPEGIFTALSEVEGAIYQALLENRKSVVSPLGEPPHSVFPIVDGGSDIELGQALLRTVAAGIDFTDDTDVPSASWTSVDVTNPANGQIVTVWFARPSPVSAPVVIEIETQANFPADGVARIKSEIVAFANQWPNGKTLFSSRLYSPANNVPGHEINSLTIDGTDRLVLQPFERVVLTEADVTVNIA
jgi:uncharacterized phage protein gp47/JayE